MARDNDGIFTEKWADGGDTGEPVGFDRDEGWPISYSQPGGNHPTRLLFNLLFKELSALAIELNQNGVGLEYNATINYIAKAIVRGSDGDCYIAASANGPATSTKDPVGDTTGVWELFYLNTSSNVVTGTANNIILNAISGINPSALFDGQLFTFKAATDNLGNMAIQVGALTNTVLKHGDGTNLLPGEIRQDDYSQAVYNKADNRFELVSIGRDIPSGKKILFYENTAVLGYTLLNTLDDKVVYVTKGSAAGGQTGGAVHSAGTWTQPNHSHTGPSHWHDVYVGYSTGAGNGLGFMSNSGGAAFTADRGYTAAGAGPYASVASRSTYNGTGATGVGATANTWRPAAYSCTLQQRI